MEKLASEQIRDKWLRQLEKDCNSIIEKKLPKALELDNEGRYRNLTKIIAENLELIDKYGWNQHATKYYADGKQHVSYWKQNYDCKVKEHYDFIVDEEATKEYVDKWNNYAENKIDNSVKNTFVKLDSMTNE